jgi:poly(A) polymerase
MTKRIFRRMRFPVGYLSYIKKIIRLRPHALIDDGATESTVHRLTFDAGEIIDDFMTLDRVDIALKVKNLLNK